MSTAPQQLDPAFEQLVARNDELMVENESLVAENDRLREIARLAERFARARGRYHSQNAAYDLMEAFNLPCVRPFGGAQGLREHDHKPSVDR